MPHPTSRRLRTIDSHLSRSFVNSSANRSHQLSHFLPNLRKPLKGLRLFLAVAHQFLNWPPGRLCHYGDGAARSTCFFMWSLGLLRTWSSQHSLLCLTIVAVGSILQQWWRILTFEILSEYRIFRIFRRQRLSKTFKSCRWSFFSGQVSTS